MPELRQNQSSEQALSGVLLVDKPSGLSSMRVLNLVKFLSGQKKVGHCGTLDPLASGLMVVLLGKATKLQHSFLSANKSYSGTIKLGLKTDTDDIIGNVIKEKDLSDLFKQYSREEIVEKIIEKFQGSSMQRPPNFSAIKVSGKRSYALARKGKAVELKSREVKIEFKDLRFHNYSSLRFEISCTKGTYVRALARDIGKFLGCGACIDSLRRTASNPFSLSQAYSLDQIREYGAQTCVLNQELLKDISTIMLGNEAEQILSKLNWF